MLVENLRPYTVSTAPHFDIDVPAFWQDPYPTLARMRKQAPIAFVPQLGSTLLCNRDDIFICEKQIDVFSSHQPEGLMNRLMGHNMMRKDGDAHMNERKAIFPTISPKTVKSHWTAQFAGHATRILDELKPDGVVDFVQAFALPFSAECLKSITGLTNMRFQDMNAWSQGMIDGIANYVGDPAIEARCHAATSGIDAAIDEMAPRLRKAPDLSLLGVLLQPQFVGFYSVAQRLEEAVYIGVLKIGEILFPFFSTLQKEDDDRKVDLLLRSSWILNVLAASALGGLIPVAGALLYRWTGAEVAAEAQLVLVVLAISGILGSSANVFAYYLLSQGRSSYNALISLVTGFFTLATSAIALPIFGWQAAGWSSCVGMVAQVVITVLLLRRTFRLSGMWSRMLHFVLIPLGTGVAIALALRSQLGHVSFDHAPSWWYVVSLYGVSAAVIFVAAVAVSQLGPYRSVCWRDLRIIITRFLPFKAA